MWETKLLISQVKKKDFLPQNDQICFFGALLVGQLVVVAHGLYLARYLFTLLQVMQVLIIIDYIDDSLTD